MLSRLAPQLLGKGLAVKRWARGKLGEPVGVHGHPDFAALVVIEVDEVLTPGELENQGV